MKQKSEAVVWIKREGNKQDVSVPDIEAKEINGGHDFKTSLMAGFEIGLNKVQETALRFLLRELLQACIQMDVDADGHGEKGIAFPGMDAHIMQMVIIKHPVIYPFAGSPVVVNLLIFFRTSWHRGIEPDVPVRFCVNTAAIGGWGTFLLTGAGVSLAAGKGTAPFAGMLLLTIAPVDHAETGHAQGSAIRINRDRVWNGIRSAPVRVKVDERADPPFFAEPISGIVVMCGIETEVADRDIRVDGPKLPQGDDSVNTVVPSGIEEADMEWEVNANVCIM